MMKKGDKLCDLTSCFLCSRCLPQWRLCVEEHRVNKSIKKGAQIFGEGEVVEGIFFMYAGKAKVHKKWGSERDLIIKFAQRGDIIGYRGYGAEKVYPVSATALEDTTVCFIDIDFFEATMQVNHALTYELMKFYAGELQEAERRMNNLVHMEVKGRIAETILMLKRTFGADDQGFIDVQLTRQDMASYAGTIYETFSRVTNELVSAKTIKFAGKNVAILNEEELLKLVTAVN